MTHKCSCKLKCFLFCFCFFSVFCIYSNCGDNNLVPLRLWWGETMLKDKKKPRSILWGSVWRVFSSFLILKKVWKLQKCSCFGRKTESFHKFCPCAFSRVVCAIFLLEWKVQNSTWKMSNVAIFHIPDSLDFNFFKVKSSRDTNICRKFKRQGVWTELKSEFCFLR